ncbi:MULTISPECIES: membrane protein YczE [unclassified Arthrobacter]|uniref:membrane protein YczE n=1 Tax=unclassified Arthrobacter TaxID=235627 RepID=UPI001D13D041|nr:MULTISPECIES: hypothetical protein [unclassified Arthrobacter]MCC3274505.1 hypothetical protein [Arthrobacter sp. zg-Y20]MCC3279503.1 hypothetical protein [Arthrobacter sp. zg-Y40]MCC9177903.1 hypothetical protein [Arthrobacter sp. zg-Y750]MDK1314662.1 hypothetical protein [Arthrobacter sp. zg.Y20]MDK1327546.1 hypothetical protein [Arthrobacter sp. zg-Y1143]
MSWNFVRRVLQLLIGVFCYGFSISMMIRAGLGVSPWDVLGQGTSLQSGLPFGLVANLIGIGVLLLWIPLRQRPGVGTVVNTLAVGPSAEVGLLLLDPQTELPGEILLFTGGLVLLAVATGLYIGARMGPGPRDGLMTGLHRRLGWPVWVVRTGIEVIVLVVGWFLGGTVGIGTVAFAILIGPMVNRTLPLLNVPERRSGPAAG